MTESEMLDTEKLSRAVVSFIERGDVAGHFSQYAPGATIWHNFDQADKTPDQAAPLLKLLIDSTRSIRFQDFRVSTIPGGWVQRHNMIVESSKGEKTSIPAVMFITVDSSHRILRVEEYLDLNQLQSAIPLG